MGSAKAILLAGAMTLLALPAAKAADLPAMPMKAPVIHDFSGWYLRGDVGMTNQKLSGIYNVQMDTATNLVWSDKGSFDSGWMFGIGVGYNFNSWLRADLTGEYRGKTQFHALDRHAAGSNDYTASKSEWVALANLYIDLGTWYGLTPFIGAGVGVAYNKIDHYRDINVIAGGGGWADSGTKANLAWAAHAGVSYRVTPGFSVELAYRYLNIGDAKTADTINLDGSNPILNNSTFFNGIYSHDIKLGVRWMLDTPEPAYSPLMRKG